MWAPSSSVLKEISTSLFEKYEAVGVGEDWRYEGKLSFGKALHYGADLIHFSAFGKSGLSFGLKRQSLFAQLVGGTVRAGLSGPVKNLLWRERKTVAELLQYLVRSRVTGGWIPDDSLAPGVREGYRLRAYCSLASNGAARHRVDILCMILYVYL